MKMKYKIIFAVLFTVLIIGLSCDVKPTSPNGHNNNTNLDEYTIIAYISYIYDLGYCDVKIWRNVYDAQPADMPDVYINDTRLELWTSSSNSDSAIYTEFILYETSKFYNLEIYWPGQTINCTVISPSTFDIDIFEPPYGGIYDSGEDIYVEWEFIGGEPNFASVQIQSQRLYYFNENYTFRGYETNFTIPGELTEYYFGLATVYVSAASQEPIFYADYNSRFSIMLTKGVEIDIRF